MKQEREQNFLAPIKGDKYQKTNQVKDYINVNVNPYDQNQNLYNDSVKHCIDGEKETVGEYASLEWLFDINNLKYRFDSKSFRLFQELVEYPIADSVEKIFVNSKYGKMFKWSNSVLYAKTGNLWIISSEKDLYSTLAVCLRDFCKPFCDFLKMESDLPKRLKVAGSRFLVNMDRSSILHRTLLLLRATINDRDFVDLLDNDYSIIPLKSKVYCLNTHKIRPYTDTDYFSKSFAFDFNEKTDVTPAFKLLKSIFPDTAVLNYALYQFSSWMDSRNPNDTLLFFKGVGTNPEIKALEKVKVAFLSEPEAGKMKTNFIKRLCNSDEISSRNLFSNKISRFKLRTKFVVTMNDIPSFSTVDDALWRRVKILPFQSKFVDKPKNKHEKKMDRDLGHAIETDITLKTSLFALLIHSLRDFKNLTIDPPEACVLALETVKIVEDDFRLWLKKNIVYKHGKILTKRELFNRYECVFSSRLYLTREQKEKVKIINSHIEEINTKLEGVINHTQRVYDGVHKELGNRKTVRGYKNLWFFEDEEKPQ
ncbi:putative DNA primase/helicase [Vairimorpha necatrix]|uniref:DNA primase/helicase n=1 Tax=Vairimorpha necatrix TaxID=6039 RepID=A0AAX4JAS8_9MICR